MFLRKKVGIDLGTANTLVYVGGVGIVLNEPTVVSYSIEDRRILAVGDEAREMLGRTPGSIIASRPMKEGVIADFTTTCAMITYFLNTRNLYPKKFHPAATRPAKMTLNFTHAASGIENCGPSILVK